ncbi:MAG: site-2 protease family protein [Candidatus Promineifilaceae bacterium]
MLILQLAEQGIEVVIGFILVMICAFAYHEFAHAIVADRLGDPTPRQHGRMTLNPFPHLSLFGLIMLLVAGFGWATTPVRPNLLRGNPRVSMAWVAVAGPVANLIMAILFAIPIRLVQAEIIPYPQMTFLITTAELGVYINVLLVVFNLLPIPPLDGFTILLGVLPAEVAYRLAPLRQYGPLILIVVLFLIPSQVFDIWGLILTPAINSLSTIIRGY